MSEQLSVKVCCDWYKIVRDPQTKRIISTTDRCDQSFVVDDVSVSTRIVPADFSYIDVDCMAEYDLDYSMPEGWTIINYSHRCPRHSSQEQG